MTETFPRPADSVASTDVAEPVGVQLGGVDSARRADLTRQRERELSAAGADVGYGLAVMELQSRDEARGVGGELVLGIRGAGRCRHPGQAGHEQQMPPLSHQPLTAVEEAW